MGAKKEGGAGSRDGNGSGSKGGSGSGGRGVNSIRDSSRIQSTSSASGSTGKQTALSTLNSKSILGGEDSFIFIPETYFTISFYEFQVYKQKSYLLYIYMLLFFPQYLSVSIDFLSLLLYR